MPENITEYRFGELEYRANENRQDGDALGTISGTVLRYGDVARFPWGTERFEPGAFGDLSKISLWANRMHQRTEPLANTLEGSLRFTDSKEALRGEIDLPDTTAGRNAATEVARGLLRGLSIEFRTVCEEVDDKNERIIREAQLFGWGLVDRPAYPQSTLNRWADYFQHRMSYGMSTEPQLEAKAENTPEIDLAVHPNVITDDLGRQVFLTEMPMDEFDYEGRQVANLVVEGRLPYGEDGIVSMARNEVVRFLPGAFTASLAGEIVLLAGNSYDHIIAGTAARNLILEDSDEALRFRARNLARHDVLQGLRAQLGIWACPRNHSGMGTCWK